MVSELIPAIRQTLKDGGFAKIENSIEEGGTFLVGYAGRLFQIYGDFQVAESADLFDACGAGMDVALGVLHATRKGANPRARLQAALEAASRYNASVRPPFVFESL